MTGSELAHAQRVLGTLRHRVDEGIASVVHQDVQGEGGVETQMSFPFGASSFTAVRHWPEPGWPDQVDVETAMRIKVSDPDDPKIQGPGKPK